MEQSLQLGADDRLSMSVEGDDPVRIGWVLEIGSAESDTWMPVDALTVFDDDPDAIVESGVVAFSTNTPPQAYRYDDFAAVSVE